MNLPRSAPTRHTGWFLLLVSVDLRAPAPARFAGQYLTPGAAFDPEALPRPAIAIEYAGRVRIAPHNSRYAFADLRVLWRYDTERAEWVEAMRSTEDAWVSAFGAAAHRLLYPSGEPSPDVQARPAVERISQMVADELASIRREPRCYALRELVDRIAGELIGCAEDLSVAHHAEGFPLMGAPADGGPLRARPPEGWGMTELPPYSENADCNEAVSQNRLLLMGKSKKDARWEGLSERDRRIREAQSRGMRELHRRLSPEQRSERARTGPAGRFKHAVLRWLGLSQEEQKALLAEWAHGRKAAREA